MSLTATNTEFHWGLTGQRWQLTVTKSAEQLARETGGDPVATFVGATVVIKFGADKGKPALVTFASGSGLTITDAQQDSLTALIETYSGWADQVPEPEDSRLLDGQIELTLTNGQKQVEDQGLTLKIKSSY